MELFKYLALCTVCVCVCLVCVQAADTLPTETFNLEKYCNGSGPHGTNPILDVHKAAFVKLDLGSLGQTVCNVRVDSKWETDDSSLRMQIFPDDLNLPCNGNTSLQIYHARIRNGTSIAYPSKICSDGQRSYQAAYLNEGPTIRLRLLVPPDMLANVSLRFLFTATAYSHERKNPDFRCDNNLLVAVELKCDGNNNCGDGSDENKANCDLCEAETVKFIGVSVGFGVGALMAVAAALTCCMKQKREFQRQLKKINQDQEMRNRTDENARLVGGAQNKGWSWPCVVQ